MAIQNVQEALNSLVKLHEALLEISREKTEVIKEGKVEKLQAILVKEKKRIRELEKAEALRIEVVETYVNEHPAITDASITSLLEHLDDNEVKAELTDLAISLTETITKLKQQEQLNQALISQSMQFVQLSLDLINPSLKNMNYGEGKAASSAAKRSVFDSKA
ncbi:flagellar protein FlgN [Oceanobacillus manasiensis]|uniref:flagellar protein FlgN n=1 Tax=Oceanobacillus manasiensis TaxID=586413 RepID=UPI0005A6A462|nr:flagellar protein FlgN [Oceanobacillus manasiensis]